MPSAGASPRARHRSAHGTVTSRHTSGHFRCCALRAKKPQLVVSVTRALLAVPADCRERVIPVQILPDSMRLNVTAAQREDLQLRLVYPHVTIAHSALLRMQRPMPARTARLGAELAPRELLSVHGATGAVSLRALGLRFVRCARGATSQRSGLHNAGTAPSAPSVRTVAPAPASHAREADSPARTRASPAPCATVAASRARLDTVLVSGVTQRRTTRAMNSGRR